MFERSKPFLTPLLYYMAMTCTNMRSEQRYADNARVQRAEHVADELEAQRAARDLLAKRGQ